MIASHNGEPSAFDRVEVIFNPPSTGTVSQMAEQLRTNLSQRLPTMPVQLSPTERAGHGRELAQTVPRGWPNRVILRTMAS